MSLTPETEAFIDGRVASGRFRSAGEVVRAALRLPKDDERKRQEPEPWAGTGARRVAR